MPVFMNHHYRCRNLEVDQVLHVNNVSHLRSDFWQEHKDIIIITQEYGCY